MVNTKLQKIYLRTEDCFLEIPEGHLLYDCVYVFVYGFPISLEGMGAIFDTVKTKCMIYE